MLTYLVRRILGILPTLALLAVIVFFTLRLAPGGPFDSERVFPPEIQKNIQARYGLDQPLLTQFRSWARDVLTGDLRESFQYLGRPVSQIVSQAAGPSALLGGCALLLSVIIGVPIGVISAWKRGSFWDALSMGLAIGGVSLPSYLAASLLVLLFSLYLGWLPPALWEGPESMILPVITLSLRPLALVARLTRASVIEALQADYIRTALGKGLSWSRTLFKHALRNSLIPVVTLLGPLAASLITGSFLVETVFQIPGLGKHFVTAVINRDYPLVMGVTLFYGVILIAANIGVDLTVAWIDPRVRLEGRS